MANLFFTTKITGEMSYSLEFKQEDTAGTFIFGFGETGSYQSESQINFTGISGKLYDQDGNFFFSYSSGVPLLLEGNVFTGHHNYSVNGKLINSLCTRETGSFDTFYFNNMDPGFGLIVLE